VAASDENGPASGGTSGQAPWGTGGDDRQASGGLLDSEMMLHRNMHARPDRCLKAIAPSREKLVVAVEWIFT
jgi:hypothetical protein